MKLAFAGKGGVGKTSVTSWMADWLARNGHNVWMIDADTALSLGQASGLDPELLPLPIISRKDLVHERIHEGGFLNLNPDVGDLSDDLAVDIPLSSKPLPGVIPGRKRLLVMGGLTNAGGGCACDANALLKAILAHVVMDSDDCVLVDLEAGVEHLGRGTVTAVDGLVVVTEPSLRSFQTASDVGRMGLELGLDNQAMVINRYMGGIPPELPHLPKWYTTIPPLAGLVERQMTDGNVLSLPESDEIDIILEQLVKQMGL
ncbi:ArsA-related P-loop ATPase [Maridesulfovibrio ferrireducens]|uniref:ATP-binding protein n=1 Tax=Maridesulfovibrio ferrireducens TaxID=246191 RepID=UPI001A2627C7|nr:ArsA-related P-loop ATPase [Maridesulfovibrio ferrireducens]MBI9110541.1 AAA family ATPase [Maridesulfovibrio ferrireducens]